eukprot:2556588-Prymnesium_polylepis.1
MGEATTQLCTPPRLRLAAARRARAAGGASLRCEHSLRGVPQAPRRLEALSVRATWPRAPALSA